MLTRAWRRRDPATGELEADPPVHLTVARGTRRVRRAGLMDHRRPLVPEFVTHVHGLRVTTVERTWLDLCSLTPPWTFEDLVAAGDHAVRHPWTPAGRTGPATTIAALRSALRASGRFHGRPAAREALDSVRVGADSPPETRLRLALVADLAYRHVRLALQYDAPRHLGGWARGLPWRRRGGPTPPRPLPLDVSALQRTHGGAVSGGIPTEYHPKPPPNAGSAPPGQRCGYWRSVSPT